ncbi:dTMP kinase [Desulfovibrio sp. OttesenSCG-928-F20]|nr:dTMP kinase [Desulfovibrio sp. OttesenSCG-928-F20]
MTVPFITLEGIEGSGKSTALGSLCTALEQAGKAFLRSREPGASELGRSLRTLLLDAKSQVLPEAELFLYLADRAQHVGQIIRPALEQGLIVLSDRYADSTIVYQGYGRGLDVERLYALNQDAVKGLWPDLSILYDLPAQTGLQRARQRNEADGTTQSEGRFEAEALAFHQRIRQGYLDWAARFPGRFRIIDASAPAPEVARQTILLVMNHLQQIKGEH